MKTARQLVAEALASLDARAAWSNRTLDAMLQKNNLSEKDRAFAGALFYGVLERRITLDACIAAHSSRPPQKLDDAVRNILHMGLYQLLYMDSVSAYAAVSESVALAEKLRKKSAGGMINAVLRSFLRAGKEIPLPQGAEERLSVAYSCPVELVRFWQAAYGKEATEGILQQSVCPQPIYLRTNTLRTTPQELAAKLAAQGIACSADELLPECLQTNRSGALHATPEYEQGLFHLQDRSSQICALALGAQPGERILDACAAPGGKSFTIAGGMKNQGQIVACDLREHRTELVRSSAARLGFALIDAQTADMTRHDRALGLFDRVLCDVPCSGLGTIGRKPEIKYKPLDEFAELPGLQYKILENTAQYCKEGGVLLYSTCTLSPRENQQVTQRFLEAHAEFAPDPIPAYGSWEHTVFPAPGVGDGFYMARFVRKKTTAERQPYEN